jgi:Rieske Fe-S protein
VSRSSGFRASAGLAVTRLSEAEAVTASRICTHQSCTVALPGAPEATLDCPCHGSRFRTNGQVVNGPAARALAQFPTRIVGNEVVINTNV